MQKLLCASVVVVSLVAVSPAYAVGCLSGGAAGPRNATIRHHVFGERHTCPAASPVVSVSLSVIITAFNDRTGD
jgi:hypothetical protein